MKDANQKCIYCSNEKATTRDHVPPKSFFPKPRPSDLLTVPCCLKCNKATEKDEELFLATFMFSQAGVSKEGKRLWAEKINRMYEKNKGLRRIISNSLKHYHTFTPAGIYAGGKMTIEPNLPRAKRVVEKIVRGLYFHQYHVPLPNEKEVLVEFLNTESKSELARKNNNSLHPGNKAWPGVFEYRHNSARQDPEESMWLMMFYSSIYFFAVTG